MSILKKPYELSIWLDDWDAASGKFVEKKIATIGSDQMFGQIRAIEPNLTRNVNGTKKLTFKMYKKYVDTQSGEKVDNPFCQLLVNERKVKLKYKKKWYDFIVKNIVESSSGKTCTYQLEDALVQELSRNGFNVTLNEDLMNNVGTAKTLAEYTLSETDWKIESETFVQTIEEPLVYVTIAKGTPVTRLRNSHSTYLQDGLVPEESTLNKDITALAFYSSCRTCPHRFQFIYVEDALQVDEEQRIVNKDSQYFIEVESAVYEEPDSKYGFALPKGVKLTNAAKDETISVKYRGNRYGFAQKAKYSPLLKRYVNEYVKQGQTYYGYSDTEYQAPILITNLVSNTEFKNTSGWTGAATGNNAKAEVKNVYGYFDGGKFISALDVLDKLDQIECKPYLEITFDNSNYKNQIVLNSGPYDNRTLIDNMPVGSKWILETTANKSNKLILSIAEYDYDSSEGSYKPKENGISFTSSGNTFTVSANPYTSSDLFKKNSKLKIAIQATEPGTYYIEDMSFFRAKYSGKTLIRPDGQNLKNIEEGTITKTYYYLKPEELDKSKIDDIKYSLVSDSLDSSYERVYNDNGEKINTVAAKESNYFNILQSIAETFECWLSLEVERDDNGAILSKTAKFKNYAGKVNHAAFRYGINLVDIQRTFESRNIVTKLIVKQNSNSLADGGFCTIARAAANETGENYIYNFSYYQDTGLLNVTDYINTLYERDGAKGEDIKAGETEYNLKGYFPRLRAINDNILIENKKLSGIAVELLKYKANYDVSDAALSASISGLEEVTEDVLALTKLPTITEVFGLSEKSSQVEKYVNEYVVYKQTEKEERKKKALWETRKNQKQEEYDLVWETLEKYYDQKEKLNKLFYEKYSRFIQEGTWISEDYVDDEKYYIDAKAVMYNSCFPRVAYTISALNISQLAGYEKFDFELGDQTYAEDGDLFGYNGDGSPKKEQVIISEITENLDDPSKNTNKVQNFKDQFQDLFQKITAATQSAQYNSGTYAQGAAMAKAIAENKSEFLNEALKDMTVNLTNNPVLESSSVDGSSSIKVIDGKILFGTENDEGEKSWTVGMSSKGISANKITAGQINTGEVQIMSGDDPTFRWDDKGISAYDHDRDSNGIVSNVNTKTFVRFDKYGLYGIKEVGVDGEFFVPEKIEDIEGKSTFALTWEGLKVTGNNNVVAKIGKQDDSILVVNDGEKNTFKINNDGNVEITGVINATAGKFGNLAIQDVEAAAQGVKDISDAVGDASGKVTAASITTAINKDGSGIQISADRINLKGKVTFEAFDDDTKSIIEADSIDVQIWSSRGNIFKSGDTATVLTCHVFKAGVDITNTLQADAFTWEKINNDGSKDESWQANPHGNHGNAIQISASDVWNRAMFNCKVEI